MELSGTSALVTGGAGGLGSATVRRLAAAGVTVVIVDRDVDGASRVASELGERVVVTGGDVADETDVQAAVDAAQALGPLSIVVNIAGGAAGGIGRTIGRDGSPHSLDAFIGTMTMNAVGTFNVTRLAAAAMAGNEPDEDGQRGVIVNTGSLAGLEGQTGQVAYAAAKAAILGMTLPLARDLSAIGVRVCAIAPGTMGTPIMMTAPQALQERLVADIQFPKRMGKPDEFAQLVEMIVRNPYLNGENFRLDGALRFPPK